MNIALLGATGFTGRILLKRLLDEGHRLKLLVRNPDKLSCISDRATLIKGDFFNPHDVESVIKKTDAVMSTIGPSKHVKSAAFADKCSSAMHHLISVMETQGPKRFIFMAGAAMAYPGEELNLRRRYMAFIIKHIAKKAWEGKTREIKAAFESSLDITVVRPPFIIAKSSGQFTARETYLGGSTVAVSDIADFMVKQLTSDKWIHKAPVVWNQCFLGI
jgi:putative NADH-flavin reductase